MKRKADTQRSAKTTKKSKNRKGFSSVARTRGAAVTGEMKYFDTVVNGTALVASTAWTGTEFDGAAGTLFVPVVGAGVNQRIGKGAKVIKIKIHGLIQGNAQSDQTAADNPAVIRLALVQDTQSNSVQAQGEEVFTATGNAASIPLTFQNIDNFGRFKVLRDKTIVLQNPNFTYDGTNVEQQGLVKTWKISHTFKKPVPVRFNATNGGTFADIVDNSFHIMANSSSIGLAPAISYYCRICFKE